MKKRNFWLILLIGVLFVIFLVSFFHYFKIVPKVRINQKNGEAEEKVEYSYKKAYYIDSIKNSLDEEIKPKENEIFLCISYSAKNISKKEIFYVSIVDDPKIITEDGEEFSPDLSLSKEPFGDLEAGEIKEGFLTFRIPKNLKPKSFRIGNYSKDIKGLD